MKKTYYLRTQETTKCHVGKISEKINPDQVNIQKNNTNFKLSSNKLNFTGNMITDQKANYLLIKIPSAKEKSDFIDVIPINNWYFFTRDVNFNITADEIEETRRNEVRERQNILEIQTSKVKPVRKEDKKDPKINKIKQNLSSTPNPFNKIFEDEKYQNYKELELKEQKDLEKKEKKRFKTESSSDEDEKLFKKKTKTKKPVVEEEDQQSERDSYKAFENSNPDLVKKLNNINEEKIEVIPIEKKKVEKTETSGDEEEEDLSSLNRFNTSKKSDSESDFFELEQLEKKDKETNFLGKKRQSENPYKTTIEEALRRIFLRHKSLSYKEIIKELSQYDFTINEIRESLDMILDKKFSKFKNSNEEFIYFTKL